MPSRRWPSTSGACGRSWTGSRPTPPAPGFTEVLVPGDFERRTRVQRLANGIEVPVTITGQIRERAQKLGVTIGEEAIEPGDRVMYGSNRSFTAPHLHASAGGSFVAAGTPRPIADTWRRPGQLQPRRPQLARGDPPSAYLRGIETGGFCPRRSRRWSGRRTVGPPRGRPERVGHYAARGPCSGRSRREATDVCGVTLSDRAHRSRGTYARTGGPGGLHRHDHFRRRRPGGGGVLPFGGAQGRLGQSDRGGRPTGDETPFSCDSRPGHRRRQQVWSPRARASICRRAAS